MEGLTNEEFLKFIEDNENIIVGIARRNNKGSDKYERYRKETWGK